jgi:NCS1 family nucleobase:cation symporter-1
MVVAHSFLDQVTKKSTSTWRYLTFNNYWLLINTNISTYLTGSALIPLGLTWWQAFICIIIGNLLAAGFTVLNSLPGAHYHGTSLTLLIFCGLSSPNRNREKKTYQLTKGIIVGYPVINRVVWGMWASQFAVWNRIFLSLGKRLMNAPILDFG